jgi:hypothetical protein
LKPFISRLFRYIGEIIAHLSCGKDKLSTSFDRHPNTYRIKSMKRFVLCFNVHGLYNGVDFVGIIEAENATEAAATIGSTIRNHDQKNHVHFLVEKDAFTWSLHELPVLTSRPEKMDAD